MEQSVKEKNLIEVLALFYDNYFSNEVPIVEAMEKNDDEKANLLIAAALSIWFLGVATNNLKKESTLWDAFAWFLGSIIKEEQNRTLTNWFNEIDLSPFSSFEFGEKFIDLFPFLIEVFETRDELFLDNGAKRKKKREQGIFYTPSDVTLFMIENTMKRNPVGEEGTWLDPACGTGIFLRNIVEFYIRRGILLNNPNEILNFIVSQIYGIDISRQAVQSCAFVLLSCCMSEESKIQEPWFYWQLIKGNLAVFDSTSLLTDRIIQFQNKSAKIRLYSRKRLLEGKKVELNQSKEFNTKPLSISTLFPEIEEGFSYLVTNPPYSVKILRDIYKQKTLHGEITEVTVSIRKSYVYLDFIRMMWVFCKKKSSASIVIPLSITFNSNDDFKEIRKEISRVKGDWFIASFDRTPDSLFGDNVKTRNAIMFLSRYNTNQTKFNSTSLLRWNSRNRNSFFKTISFVSLGEIPIEIGIPKIGSEFERMVYSLLRNRNPSLKKDILSQNSLKEDQKNLFIGGTAYNWLPVYRSEPEYSDEEISFSKLRKILFPSIKNANIMYGLLCSRILYWLWRVEGDGFHVNISFIESIPITPSDFSADEQDRLEQLSLNVWEKVRQTPSVSNNAGVLTISYPPQDVQEEIDEIDKMILKVLGIDEERYSYFKNLMRNIIQVGRENER